VLRRASLLVLLFALHALPFAVRPAIIGGDEPHYLLMAHSIGVDGDMALEHDYETVVEGSPAAGDRFRGKTLDRHLALHNGGQVFIHPLGLPLLIAPLIAAQHAVAPEAAPDILAGLFVLVVTFLALLAGIDLLAKRCGDRRAAWTIGLAVYVSTPLWFYSRTLFTEPLLWAFAVLACWCLSGERWSAAGFALGLVFALKEIGLLIVVAVGVWVLLRRGSRRAALVSLGPIAIAIAWIVKNIYVYGAPFATAQPWSSGDPLGGAVGLLIDPHNGLFVFAPIALAALAAVAMRGVRWDASALAAIALSIVWFAIAASWSDWRGGSSYGPRLIVPILPLLAIPLVDGWNSRSRALQRTIAALAVAGFVLNAAAASEPFHAFWNASPFAIISRQPAAAAAATIIGVTVAAVHLRETIRADARGGSRL
jgi:hypothetical protein